MDSAVVCATNFTVVKVDIELSDIVEKDDETALPPVEFVADNADGSLSKTGLRSLYQMKIKCEPYDVPGSVDLQFSSGIRLFEITSFDGDKPVSAVPAQSSYPCGEIGQKKFGSHGLSASVLEVGELIVARHALSGALDYARVKVVPPPPLEVSVEFKSPANGGGWPYDPVWDDPEWELTVKGKSEDCANDTDEALVIYTLGRDASKVDGVICKRIIPLLPGSEVDSFVGLTCEGVHTNSWDIGPTRKTGAYYAEVVAIEKETGKPRDAKSDDGRVLRDDWCKSSANEVEEPGLAMRITQAEVDADGVMRSAVVSVFVAFPFMLIPGAPEITLGTVILACGEASFQGATAYWLTKPPAWFNTNTFGKVCKWSVTHHEWRDDKYSVMEDITRSYEDPDLGRKTEIERGIFDVGYQCFITSATGLDEEGHVTSEPVLGAEGFYSDEFEQISIMGSNVDVPRHWKVDGVWQWKDKPYGLKKPTIIIPELGENSQR